LDPQQRIVTVTPLGELWTDAGSLRAQRVRPLTLDEVRNLLRQGPLRLAVADCGKPLRWIDRSDCFEFWKEEVKPRVASSEAFFLEDYPGEYCYAASEWTVESGESLILLEMYH
jgi:hypothetical protein